MKPQASFLLAVLTLGATPLFAASGDTAPAARINGRQIDVIAVAERFLPIRPTATRPISALVIDAGYVELGYPTKGEKPPPQKIIAGSFIEVLTTQGFQPATPAMPAARFQLSGLMQSETTDNTDAHGSSEEDHRTSALGHIATVRCLGDTSSCFTMA